MALILLHLFVADACNRTEYWLHVKSKPYCLLPIYLIYTPHIQSLKAERNKRLPESGRHMGHFLSPDWLSINGMEVLYITSPGHLRVFLKEFLFLLTRKGDDLPALEHWEEDSRIPSKESRNGCPSQDSNVLLSPTGTILTVESLKIKSCF